MEKIFFKLRNIWGLYSKKMRYIFLLIIFLIFVSASGEFFAIISIKPLISNILNSNNNEEFINMIFFKIENKNFLLLCFILLISLFTALFLRLINFWLITKFSARTGTLIATKIFTENVLTKYYDFDKKESSYTISALTNQLSATVTGLINIFKLFSSIIICLFISYALLINNFFLNSLATLLFVSTYILSYLFVKEKLNQNSQIIKTKAEISLRVIKDSFGANKEIISNNLQDYFQKLFIKSDWPPRNAKASNYIFKMIPRSSIELIAYSIIILLSIISINDQKNSILLVSFIGSLAFSIQRLMPQMQTIFSSWTFIRGERASIYNVLNLLENIQSENPFLNIKESLTFNSIDLENIKFSFLKDNPLKSNYIFNDFNLSIKAGEKIAIVGKSGVGKSTLLDILTGIIKPNSGHLKINGIDIHLKENQSHLYKWRNTYSILNQKPYFFNSSILENIAIGEKFEEIDLERVYESAKKAMIFDYINSLRDKFLTNIGDNGSKLSGGQAQRIGIARAIYKNKNILIMDEATSALDEETENEIVKSLKSISSEMTLIIISHKKQILKLCDQIIKLD